MKYNKIGYLEITPEIKTLREQLAALEEINKKTAYQECTDEGLLIRFCESKDENSATINIFEVNETWLIN